MLKFVALLCLVLVALASPIPAHAGLFSSDKSEASAKADNVYEYIRNQKDLSRFADMIGDAGLKDVFKDSAQTITVFAPTNDAIGDISGADMKKIKASKESLQSFVRNHFVSGSRMPLSALRGRKSSAAAANGESIMFDGTNDKDPVKVGAGHLVSSDGQVGNSIVHSISAALMPSSLKEEPKEAPKHEEPPPAVKPTVVEQPKPAEEVVVPVKQADDKKAGKDKQVPIGSGLPIGSTHPVGTSLSVGSGLPIGSTQAIGSSLPVGTAAPAAIPSAAPADKPKDKGFNFFGMHLGG